MYALSTTLEDGHGNRVEETFQFLSYGKGKQNPFKINPLSITPDKKEYAPGDTARLLVTSDYPDASVWTFLRNSWKNESRSLVPLDRQTALVECRLTREDMPNMGVNAFTVRNGELHTASAELLIPPAGQILEPAVTPGKSQYRPGEQGNVSIQVKGPDGTPVRNGVVALAIYDKALEYIARPNITEIAKTVWGSLNETGFLSLKKITALWRERPKEPSTALRRQNSIPALMPPQAAYWLQERQPPPPLRSWLWPRTRKAQKVIPMQPNREMRTYRKTVPRIFNCAPILRTASSGAARSKRMKKETLPSLWKCRTI